MLQRMRDGMQGWIVWLIVIIIIVALSLSGIESYFHLSNRKNNDIAAKVNNNIISQQRVTTIFHQLRAQQPNLVLTANNEQALRYSIVQKLIEQALLTEIGNKNGFKISENLLNTVITQIPQFQENGQFSQVRFSALLRQLGYTPAQFIESVKIELLAKQLQTGIVDTAFVLPDEIQATIRMIKQTRDFNYAAISFAQYLPKINISTEQAQQYYQTNLQKFQAVEKIRVNYLVLSDKQIREKINPSMSQLQEFYQTTISNYTQPEQWQIAHIVIANDTNDLAITKEKLNKIAIALKAKKDFSSLARQYSDELISAKKGGLLPWLSIASLPPTIQNTVSKLKVGDVSVPIQTADGYEIIKLLALKKAQITPFAQVTDKVKTAYIQQQAQKEFAALVKQLQDSTFQNPDSLAPAAKALNISIQKSGWLQQGQNNKGMFANPQVLQVAFGDNVRTGNNSEILYPDAHTALVLHLEDYQATKPIPFAQLEEQIKSSLALAVSKKQAQTLADKVTKELNNGLTLAQITNKYGLRWITEKNRGRYDNQQQVNSLILKAAFDLPRPSKDKLISATNFILPDKKAIIVLGVTAVHDYEIATGLPAEEHIYQTQLQNEYGQFTLFELINYYRKQAKINVYESQLIEN